MKSFIALLSLVALGLAAPAAAPARAPARADDECLEVGWKNAGGKWDYYRAWVDQYDEKGKVHIKYDFHHGEMDLRVKEKEASDGKDVIIYKGKWHEGNDATRTGLVFLTMEKGHHRAKGWYTIGTADKVRLDLALRDCKT
jgi:hypothetical protein